MNPHYNQNYTKAEITTILNKIQDCVRDNRYSIAQNENRQENIDFINEYNIRSNKQRSILLEIEPEDFCHSLKNTKLGFEHEILYVFVPKVKLFNIDDEEEIIDVYTKFNVIDMDNGSRAVVISFHRRNKPIDYLFR
ncbi:hypothetical protein SH1V18_46090 [Vallitalea longa]|uniref:Uncharacterized protein n=1 Tax=Vallitalea longa TaxID=2936439 RepID=A0A9W5YFJ6_9FIRM|nr:hypothetical protein [Vallitalea longa]GKX32129.1 hypothetical protein SH1V18_46090 [Vallitalea longa]